MFLSPTTVRFLSTESIEMRTISFLTPCWLPLTAMAASSYQRTNSKHTGIMANRSWATLESFQQDTRKRGTHNGYAANGRTTLESAITLRGGASPSDVLQNILRYSMESPSLPSPIKQFIRLVCRFLEHLTGWKILRLVPHGKLSKVKRKKSTADETKKESNKSVCSNAPIVTTDIREHSKKRKKKVVASREPVVVTPAAIRKPQRDTTSKKVRSNTLQSSNPNYRIQRELKEFLSSPPPGLSVKISGTNVRLWIITLHMPETSIYAGDTYKLRVQFPQDYPTSPPSVFFLPPTPRHEHVYTNGDICLSLLGKDWRPIMTAQSLAQAIMSILCGAQKKSLPMDNSRHAGNKPGQSQDNWVYHDDNC